MFNANCARLLPLAAASSITRKSLDTPEIPSTPDFFIHNSVYFFVVHTSFIHQEWNDSWVNIARTSTHDQARQWSEAHCSIDRTTTFDRCQGGTVTQVTCDNTKIGHVLPINSAQRCATYLWDVPWKP